ncbi:uncharacterized protein [Pseudorasbora parva]
MKKLLNIEKKSNEIAKEIHQLIQKLMSEKKEVNVFAEPDELEHHVMVEFLRAIGRQGGLNVEILNDSILNDMLNHIHQEFPLEKISDTHIHRAMGGESSSAGVGQRPRHFRHWTGTSDANGKGSSPQMRETCLEDISPHKGAECLLLLAFGYVSFFSLSNLKLKGMGTKLLDPAIDACLRSMSTPGFQAALLGTTMVFGGGAVLARALPEMIDNWTEMIMGNHVTEASKSMRDTASKVKETTRTSRKLLKILRENLTEIAKQKENSEKRKEIVQQEENSEEETEDPSTISVGLLNVRSIKKAQKSVSIKNLITENNLDVFLTTETWLKNDIADKVLREASPPNFQFYQQSRDGSRGGGVAIQFSNVLQGRRINLGFSTTFEYVAAALKHDKWEKDILFINVYHPPESPKNHQKFFDFIAEFHALLKMACSLYTSIIVAGDFNIHVENIDFLRPIIFRLNCQIYDFNRDPKLPTHKNGGILDLVLGRDVDIFHVQVRDDKISDHFTVYFRTRPQ